MDISDVFQSLLDRVLAHADGDSSKVLAPQALVEARGLLNHYLVEGAIPIEVAMVVADVLWTRHKAVPGSGDDSGAVTAMWLDSLVSESGSRSRDDYLLVPGGPVDEVLKGNRLLGQALTSDDPQLINDAVRHFERAVAMTPEGHANHARYLSNLAGALQTRYRTVGDPDDLDAAIAYGDRVESVFPPGHPDRPMCQSNRSDALCMRYGLTGDSSDLDEAVRAGRDAVDTAEPGDPERPAYLLNLAIALRNRFDRAGDPDDIAAAIHAVQESIRITATDDPRHHVHQHNLVVMTQAKYRGTEDLNDLNESIDLGFRLLESVPAAHPIRVSLLYNLGHSLLIRNQRTQAIGDVELALRLLDDASRTVPVDTPLHAEILSAAGVGRYRRYKESGDPAEFDAAIEHKRRAARMVSASAGVRLGSEQVAADLIALERGPSEALPVYRSAMDLLPALLWSGLRHADQHHLTSVYAESLARDAAACAIADGRPRTAVELLEQGRSLWWSTMQRTRSDLTELEAAHPRLAAELRRYRNLIDSPARPDDAERWERSDRDRFRAGRRFDELVERVRRLPSTPDFPRPWDFLRPTAPDTQPPGTGPTVVLNVSLWRCDALILGADGIEVIELPTTQEEIGKQVNLYLDALYRLGSPEQAGRLDLALEPIWDWLWDVVAEPVLSALGITGPPDGKWPRLWWCPTGPLTLLPIHAAGHHTRDGGATVIDRVISSYTPTLGALARARSRPASTASRDMLVVAVPRTPGFADLPGVETERRLLGTLFNAESRFELTTTQATRKNIVDNLSGFKWVHIGCHGVQNVNDPVRTGLIPVDWQASGLVGLADLTGPGNTGGEFAFLSACQTATGGVSGTDESITAVAAMHHAGWRHVIGTLWTVMDGLAASVAEDVYRGLVTDGGLDPTDAARALHSAVRDARSLLIDADRPGRLSAWTRFIHTGP